MLFIGSMRKLAVTVLAVLLLPVMASEAQVLKYSDHEPLGGMRTRFIKDVFFSAVEKESNGRLKIEGHWGGQIANGYNALSAVGRRGLADMAIVVPEYAADNLPLHQIFKSFPMGPSGDGQVAFFRRVYAEIPYFTAELQKENVVSIFIATGYPVAFFSSGPLNNLDDMKGGKWRSASFWHRDFLQNTGAIPVSTPWGSEVTVALKNGTMNGLMVNIDSAYDVKAHEAAPNALVSKNLWLGHVYILAMNKDVWDGLAGEDKEAIQRAAEVAYKTLGSVMDNSFDAMMDNMRKDGVKIRQVEKQELEKWVAATKYKDSQETWVKAQDNKGLKTAGEVLDKVRAIAADSMN